MIMKGERKAMSGEGIENIQETDPVRAIIAIDRELRPDFETINSTAQVEIIFAYRAMMERACKLFGVEFSVPEPDDDNYATARKILYLTKLEIDKLKVNLLYEKVQVGEAVVLDTAWRDKIHSSLAIVRSLVNRPEIPVQIRDSIMTKIHALDAEIDRVRTRIQAFTQVLVGLCEGVSAGATALTPAVRLLERVVGAVARVQPSQPAPLALPPPEDFGLDDLEASTEDDSNDA